MPGKGGEPAVSGGKGGEPAVSEGMGGELAVSWGKGGELAVSGGMGGELAVSWGKGGELAVSGGKGGEPAVSGGKGGEGWCRSSMPTRIDTLFLPTLFTLTFGKTSVTRRDVAITLMLEPGNLVATIECSVDNCIDSSAFSWN